MFQTFGSALLSLQQRTWLIHWSLFVFFNHPKGRDLIIDMFLYSQLYLNAIQTMCPHILRYLTTAVITNKTRRRTVLKDLVKVIQQVCSTVYPSFTWLFPVKNMFAYSQTMLDTFPQKLGNACYISYIWSYCIIVWIRCNIHLMYMLVSMHSHILTIEVF